MNHVLDGMDAVYYQHDYALEKRDALDRWAVMLRHIVQQSSRSASACGLAR